MEERALVTAYIEALDPRLRPRMRAYRDDNPLVRMLAAFRRSKVERETIRAAFGQSTRTSSSGADYPARFLPRQGSRSQVNMVELIKEWDSDDTE